MDDLEARLAALPDSPARPPAALVFEKTGDVELDGWLEQLDRPPHAQGREVQAALAKLLADPRGAAIVEGALAWLEAIGADPPPPPGLPEGFARDHAEHVELGKRLFPTRLAWAQRLAVAGHLCALIERHDPQAHATLVRLHAAFPHLSAHLHGRVLATLPTTEPARTAALTELAAHLVPRDHRAAAAAEALVLRDGLAAAPTLRAFLDALPDDWLKCQIAVAVSKRKPPVDYDLEPRWIDVLFPNVVHLGGAIELIYPLYEVKTAEPLLRALAHRDDEPYWSDLLDGLRRVDDPASAARLEALAETLPIAPAGPRLSRSRGAVLALVKRLRRKRTSIDAASFTLEAGAGTDGGPLLLVPHAIAAAWRGVPPDGPAGEGGPSDYDRACEAADDGLGALRVGDGTALVVGDQAAQCAPLPGGAWLVVAAGTVLQIEAALRDKRAWKKKRGLHLDVGDGGALLLDATHTVTSAEALPGAVATLAMAPGRYDVLEQTGGGGAVRAWRLVPAAKRA